MEAKQFDQLMQKLDVLIRIVALSSMRDLTSTEKIALLSRAGFGPKEIAEIIGTSQNVVNVRLSEMRKRGEKK
jgi:DNA-binding CsgD family transcriptional regulator